MFRKTSFTGSPSRRRYVPSVGARASPAPPSIPRQQESIVVTGTFVPVPVSENNRSVESLDARANPLLFNSVIDYLHFDSSIDLEQRAPDGVQADLSILGSTFAETLVPLNGLRMNDAQTAHHNMDIPVPLEAISRIEVLHGAGSAFYGSDALGGAVNFITAPARATELRLRAGAGNQGFNLEHLFASLLVHNCPRRLLPIAIFRLDSFLTTISGAARHRQKPLPIRAWANCRDLGRQRSPLRSRSVLRKFSSVGAHQELVRGRATGLGRSHNGCLRLSQAQRRVRAGPRRSQPLREQSHRSELAGGITSPRFVFRKQDSVAWRRGSGRQASTATSLVSMRAIARRSTPISTFVRCAASHFPRKRAKNCSAAGPNVFAPTVAGGFWLKPDFPCACQCQPRLPPADVHRSLLFRSHHLGNPALKPESTWSLDAGGNPNARISTRVTFFRRWDSIHYVQFAPGGLCQATNIYAISRGIEAHVNVVLPRQPQAQLSSTFLHGDLVPFPGSVSRYIFTYPSHEAVFAWTGNWHNWVVARTRVGVTQRFEHQAYPGWDLSLARKAGAVPLYLELENLSNTGYEEIPGVLRPSRIVIAGMDLVLTHKSRGEPGAASRASVPHPIK